MKQLRIAIVTPSFPPKSGGIATSHFNLFHLLKRRFHVHAFAYNDADSTPLTDVTRRKTPAWMAVAAPWLLRQYLRRYDSGSSFPNCSRIAAFAWGARRLRGPLKQFQPDLILMPDNNVPAYFMKKPPHAKLIWYCHNNYRRFRGNPLLPDHPPIDLDVASSMERKALRKADMVVSPSHYMIDEFRKCFGNPDIPTQVIPNFMTEDAFTGIEPFPLRPSMALRESCPIVCIPSAGTHPKGKRYVFEIVRRLHDTMDGQIGFFLSGLIPGDLQFELDSLGSDLKLHAPGHLAWRENVSRLQTCNLMVSPTLVENFSNALLEAQWLGIPVVTFDTGGNRELVCDGRTGTIVDYIDIEALVRRATELLCDAEMLARYGAAAARRARKEFSAETILRQYETYFQELTEACPRSAQPEPQPHQLKASN